ncbi:MAG: putative glycoside hydrolase [Oryzomonas sp.]|nr:putative glycoside hydrolase [Oryzomonas sp.]MDR3580911.1 putative glycoside hydrolase [Oryzomonas sp.]
MKNVVVLAVRAAIAKEAAARGFDEVQFDYVRFPIDGMLKTMTYPVYKRDVPKHDAALLAMQHRSTVIRQEKPSIRKPFRISKES